MNNKKCVIKMFYIHLNKIYRDFYDYKLQFYF